MTLNGTNLFADNKVMLKVSGVLMISYSLGCLFKKYTLKLNSYLVKNLFTTIPTNEDKINRQKLSLL